MAIFRKESARLLREKWGSASELAEEVHSVLNSDQPLVIDGPVVINNTTDEPGLTLNNYSNEDTEIVINRYPDIPPTFPGFPPPDLPPLSPGIYPIVSSPTGSPGVDGQPGPNGAPGPKGPTGDQGPPGSGTATKKVYIAISDSVLGTYIEEEPISQSITVTIQPGEDVGVGPCSPPWGEFAPFGYTLDQEKDYSLDSIFSQSPSFASVVSQFNLAVAALSGWVVKVVVVYDEPEASDVSVVTFSHTCPLDLDGSPRGVGVAEVVVGSNLPRQQSLTARVMDMASQLGATVVSFDDLVSDIEGFFGF